MYVSKGNLNVAVHCWSQEHVALTAVEAATLMGAFMLQPWCLCGRGERPQRTTKRECQRTRDVWFWQSILYAHTAIASAFTGVQRVNCDAAQRHTLGCIQGSHVTWAGPRWTWFYYTDPVTHVASPSASFRRLLEDMQRGKEPDWMAVRQVFPPVNHSPPKCSMMRGVSRGVQGGNGWKRTQCHTCYTDICAHQLS